MLSSSLESFLFILSVRRGFLEGRRPIRFSSTNRLRTVLSEIFTPSSFIIVVKWATLFLRFSSQIFLIFRSVRGVVILFLPHLPARFASRGFLLSILIFIRLTTDFETPAIAAMSLWECVECINNVCIALHFLGDVSKVLPVLKSKKFGVIALKN